MSKHAVASVDDIPPGGRRLVQVRGRTIGLFNVQGRYYAIKNACVHEGAPVCLGSVTGTFLPSAPGVYQYGMEGQILRCPWHGWEFEIATGQSIFDPTVTLKTYPVSVENDKVYIEL